MKLAVSTYSLSRWRQEHDKTVEQSLEKIAELGVEGVEFSSLTDHRHPKIDDPVKRVRQLGRRARKLGLTVCSYCVGANLLRKPKLQQEEIEQVKRHVDAAAELGVRSMRHDVCPGFGGFPEYKGPKTFAAALRIVVPALREISEYGQSRGVITTLENHGFFMQAAARIEKLIETVDHPNYRLTIDMGNFLCVNDDPVAAVRRLAKYAVMAHVKDFHVRPKRTSPGAGWFNTPTPIALRGAIVGHGVIDVPAQLKLLKRSGYDGWLSLEFEGLEDPIRGVQLGLDYLRTRLD